MKRFFAVILAVCLAGVLFVGCGSSAASYNINDVADAVKAVANVENPLDISDDDLLYDFGMEKENVEEYVGVKTGVANSAGTVLVVKAASGKIDDVKAALENYKNGILAVSENYKTDFPEAYEQVSAGRIVVKGDYAVLAIAAAGVDYADVDTAIENAIK